MLQNFSKKEKLMIFVLFIVLIGLIYYRFIYLKVNDAITSANNEAQAIQTELDNANLRLQKIKSAESKMGPGMQKMGSYNSIKAETAFLHTVLADVPNYAVTFSEVTRDGDQIRRNFNLTFTTSSYAEAVKVIKELTTGEYRCLIGDLSCNINDNGQTTMNVSGTFYETMVGGVPDSALPQDESDGTDPVTIEDFE